MSEQGQTTLVNTQAVSSATPAEPNAATEPQTAPAAPEAKTDPLAPKFAALAKREKQARILQQQSRLQAQALAKREAAIAEREKIWEEEFKSSPLEALKKRNLTYQDLTNAALNDGKFQPDVALKDLKDEIQKVRQETEAKEKLALQNAQKQAQMAEQQAVAHFQEQIGAHIEQNLEKYELTKIYDANDLVYQTVEEHFNRTKKILSVSEACELVESYLESELERTSKESKKFKSKFLNQQRAEDAKGVGKSSTTLSNNLQSSSAPSMLPQKTENDRIRRALEKLA